MLIIRNEQLGALEQAQHDAFEAALAAHLQTEHPALCEGKPDAEIRALVRASVIESRAMGFLVEDEIRRFTVCAARHGARFVAGEPWAIAVVNDELLSAGDKLRRFERR